MVFQLPSGSSTSNLDVLTNYIEAVKLKKLQEIENSYAPFLQIIQNFLVHENAFFSFISKPMALNKLRLLLDSCEQNFIGLLSWISSQAEERKLFWKEFETQWLQIFMLDPKGVLALCKVMDLELSSTAMFVQRVSRILRSLKLLKTNIGTQETPLPLFVSPAIFSIAKGILQGQEWRLLDPGLTDKSNSNKCLLRGPDNKLYAGRILGNKKETRVQAVFQREVSLWKKMPFCRCLPRFICCHREMLVFENPGWPFHKFFLFSSKLFYYMAVRFYIKELAQAVLFLHQQHFLHGNIDTDKIYVRENGNLQLCDFEFSHEIGTTEPLALRPTFFTAPEACNDKIPKTESADIWSIGMIAYQLWTGHAFGEGRGDVRDCYDFLLKNRREGISVRGILPKNMPGHEEAEEMLDKIFKIDPSKRIPNAKVLLDQSYFLSAFKFRKIPQKPFL